MSSVGYYDPFEDEENPQKRPAWQKPKDKFEERVLAACGHKFFSGNAKHSADSMRAKWDLLYQKADGADDTSRLFKAWLEHCVTWYEKLKSERGTQPFSFMLSYMNNDEKRIDWTNKNRVRILKAAKTAITQQFSDANKVNLKPKEDKKIDEAL